MKFSNFRCTHISIIEKLKTIENIVNIHDLQILMLSVLTILFLPAMTYAKGAIIGYAAGWEPAPTDAQLDRLTHVVVFQLIPNANGGLITTDVPSWLTSNASNNFLSRARQRGVSVSITVGGGGASEGFSSATNDVNRPTLVNNITKFVNQYNLDGVDIDWEFPKGDTEWDKCMSLLEDLRVAMPNKRFSIAIGADSPNPQFNSHFNLQTKSIVQTRVWVADAVHLMSYNMQGVTKPVVWATHTDVNGSKRCIDDWAIFGEGQPGFKKEKLILGCAFFGFTTATSWTAVYYKNGGGVGCDNPATLGQKVDHCYDNGYGGVLIWELSLDKNLSTTPDLLSAIWDANKLNGGYTELQKLSIPASLQIFPNPATEVLCVKLDNNDLTDYIVYNIVGHIVLQGKLKSDYTINVQSLTNGIYLLKISDKMAKVMINKKSIN